MVNNLLNWRALLSSGELQALRDVYYYFSRTRRGYNLMFKNRKLFEEFKELAKRREQWAI